MQRIAKLLSVVLTLLAVLTLGSNAARALVYASTDVPKAIPDSPGGNTSGPLVSSIITVPASPELVADVNVSLNLTHTYVGDLVIALQSPTGTTVTLLSRPNGGSGVCGGDDVNVTLDDEAGGANVNQVCQSGAGAQAYSGGAILLPANPLSAFDGEAVAGTWTLSVTDNFIGDSGTLVGWSLDIVTGQVPGITSAPSMVGLSGTALTHTFTAAGDPPPTLSYANENLPPGVTRTGDTLSGIPTTGGTYSIDVTASNGVGPDAVQTFVITIGSLPPTPTPLPPTPTPPPPTLTPPPPPPPPAPHAEDINFEDDSAARTGIPDSLVDSIHIRELYRDGRPVQWLDGDLYTSGSIGVAGVLNLGVQQAIDIFSPNGLTYFDGGAVFCLRGEGTLIWMAASQTPRHAEIIGSYSVPEYAGYTCATLFEPGTLVLVNPMEVSR